MSAHPSIPNNTATQLLVRWVGLIQNRPSATLVLISIATLLFAGLAISSLGVNSNNLDLVSPKLESRINQAEFSAVFPDIENALILVIDADSPARTKQAAEQLSRDLSNLPDAIQSVYQQSGDEFFILHGLLYLNENQFNQAASLLAQSRSFLLSLEARPNIAGLTEELGKSMRASRFLFDYEQRWTPLLEHFTQATQHALSPRRIETNEYSLFKLFEADLSENESKQQILIVQPVLNFKSVFAADHAMSVVRQQIQRLGFDDHPTVTVRMTGNPALNQEEMVGIAWDVGIAGVFCFALVVFALFLALRSVQLVIASVATLLVGLIWMAGSAALLVGHLNIVSISVGILFIGLGVDFLIHLGICYADSIKNGHSNFEAMTLAMSKIGGSLLICTVSTSIAFWVFVPTPYLGVAELGMIAGSGMFIILFLTVTLLPALLTSILKINQKQLLNRSLRFNFGFLSLAPRHCRVVLLASACVLMLSIYLVPKARFDPNIVQMRDPGTESVQAFNDLLNQSGAASPWHADVLVDNLAEAQVLASTLEQLPEVNSVLTLDHLIPKEQQQKLERLGSLKTLFEKIEVTEDNGVTLDQQLAAIDALIKYLETGAAKSETEEFSQTQIDLATALTKLAEQVESSQDPMVLSELYTSLAGELPNALEQARRSLAVKQIDIARLPSQIKSWLLAESGRARMQVFPEQDLRDAQNLRNFVSAIQAVAPHATGMAVNIAAFEQATKLSFKQALISAFVLITLLLILIWRNLSDVLLVLCPLLLSLLITVACMVVVNVPFNFTNVIVIPLMLGIGVDSGIHLVHRWHSRSQNTKYELLQSTTARAIFYSALTTVISFGSLAFSSHNGMSSMGTLLTIGMISTVLCNLIVLPALLEWRQQTREV